MPSDLDLDYARAWTAVTTVHSAATGLLEALVEINTPGTSPERIREIADSLTEFLARIENSNVSRLVDRFAFVAERSTRPDA